MTPFLLILACAEAVAQSANVLDQLDNPTDVALVERWSGLSPFSPAGQEAALKRDNGVFKGPSRVYVGPAETQINLAISTETVAAALALLKAAPLRDGAPEKVLGPTDNYPYQEIKIAGDPTLTWSQTTYDDWKLTAGDQVYTITDKTAQQAFDSIKVHFTDAKADLEALAKVGYRVRIPLQKLKGGEAITAGDQVGTRLLLSDSADVWGVPCGPAVEVYPDHWKCTLTREYTVGPDSFTAGSAITLGTADAKAIARP